MFFKRSSCRLIERLVSIRLISWYFKGRIPAFIAGGLGSIPNQGKYQRNKNCFVLYLV